MDVENPSWLSPSAQNLRMVLFLAELAFFLFSTRCPQNRLCSIGETVEPLQIFFSKYSPPCCRHGSTRFCQPVPGESIVLFLIKIHTGWGGGAGKNRFASGAPLYPALPRRLADVLHSSKKGLAALRDQLGSFPVTRERCGWGWPWWFSLTPAASK